MSNIYMLFSGVLIGIGMILPGVSGSVIAILLGVYDKLIYILNDAKKKIIFKIKELFPLLLGLFIGIIFFGNILIFFMKKYEIQTKYLFIGLILGGVPILKKEMNSKNSKINYKYAVLTFVISLLLFIIPNSIVQNNINKSFINMFIAGILYISGKIIPGISSSFFLMILGLYDYVLKILSNPLSLRFIDLIELIPFLIGCIIGFIVLVRLINKLLTNYYEKTYSSIIGFVLGSIIAIYPGFELNIKYILSIFIMIVSYSIVNKLGKKS